MHIFLEGWKEAERLEATDVFNLVCCVGFAVQRVVRGHIEIRWLLHCRTLRKVCIERGIYGYNFFGGIGRRVIKT